MHKIIFILNAIIFLTLVNEIYAVDLDNLGEQISENVNRRLAPLQNLGDRITARINRQLAPLQNLGFRISADVNERLRPLRTEEFNMAMYPNAYFSDLSNLGSEISEKVQAELAPLNNLGQQIQDSVYQGLEPVRALELNFKMKDGIGGTTIATYFPNGEKFIISNKQIYQCNGIISEENGQCSGTLTLYQVKNRKDYCIFRNNYSIVNDYICIGGTSVNVINNVITCKGNLEYPALLIKINEFNQLCQGSAERVEYKYIANVQDPAHVHIPNSNKYVKCTNNQPGICIFSESTSLPQYTGSHITINSHASDSTIIY